MLGTTIGNYQITALIGEGGMGKVYVAQHPTLARKSAIKVLHTDQTRDPVALSRFFTEAKAADAIRHPNIVEIYDYGTLPDGAPYIVMEYLEGETLAERLYRGPLTLRETLDLVAQAASALGAAHRKEVLHRDLKPDNIFLVTDLTGKVQVKIVDFGIAKLQNELAGSSHRTRTGALVGTPLYMSPEQCLGAKEVGPPSDIYALAVITYELVCGRAPFESDAVGALINMHVNEPVVSPRKRNPRIPRALETMLLKALAKAPENRQSTMEELLTELTAVRLLVDRGPPDLGDVVPEGRWARLEAPTAVPPSTISGAAHSARPAHGRGKAAVMGGVAAATVAAFLLLWHPGNRPVPTPIAPAATTATAAVPAPPPAVAAPPVAPAPVVIQLDSDPAGAQVSVDNRAVGTTPTTFTAPPGHEPLELVFTRDGYQRQIIQALPADGLKVRAHLEPQRRHPAAKNAKASAKTPARPPKALPADDIKSER